MKNNNYIKIKKQELTDNIKNSEQELKELRGLCKHSETSIKDVNPESGASHLRKVCNICDETIGFPTEQELKDSGYTSKE